MDSLPATVLRLMPPTSPSSPRPSLRSGRSSSRPAPESLRALSLVAQCRGGASPILLPDPQLVAANDAYRAPLPPVPAPPPCTFLWCDKLSLPALENRLQ